MVGGGEEHGKLETLLKSAEMGTLSARKEREREREAEREREEKGVKVPAGGSKAGKRAGSGIGFR